MEITRFPSQVIPRPTLSKNPSISSGGTNSTQSISAAAGQESKEKNAAAIKTTRQQFIGRHPSYLITKTIGVISSYRSQKKLQSHKFSSTLSGNHTCLLFSRVQITSVKSCQEPHIYLSYLKYIQPRIQFTIILSSV